MAQFTDAYISVSKVLSENYIERGLGETDNHYTVYSGMELQKFYEVRKKNEYRKILVKVGIIEEYILI